MRNLSSIVLEGAMLFCLTFSMYAKGSNSFGKISFSVLNNFDVTFDQQDLKLGNFIEEGSLKFPMAVTHIENLVLKDDIKRVEIPSSVKFINKDIFKYCNLQYLKISQETVDSLCKKSDFYDRESFVRKYFSLRNSCQINIETLEPEVMDLSDYKNNIPTPPTLNIKNESSDDNNKNVNDKSFFDELKKYDRTKLRKVNDEDINKNKPVDFTDEVRNFKREDLRKVEEKDLTSSRVKEDTDPEILKQIKNFDLNNLKRVDSDENRKKQNEDLGVLKEIKSFDSSTLKHVEVNKNREVYEDEITKQLRKAMRERREASNYDEENDDYEDSWDD